MNMIEKAQSSKLPGLAEATCPRPDKVGKPRAGKTQNLEVKSLLAALPLGKIGEGPGFGKFSLDKITDLPTAIATLISLFIGFITIAAGIWFGIKFILGAFAWISAGGNPESLKNARQTIIDALIGIVIVVGALAVISIVGTVLGFPILDIGKLLENVGVTGGGPAPSP